MNAPYRVCACEPRAARGCSCAACNASVDHDAVATLLALISHLQLPHASAAPVAPPRPRSSGWLVAANLALAAASFASLSVSMFTLRRMGELNAHHTVAARHDRWRPPTRAPLAPTPQPASHWEPAVASHRVEPVRSEPLPVSLLRAVIPNEHRPAALLARANELNSSGADVGVQYVRLAPSERRNVWSAFDAQTAAHVVTRAGTSGVQIERVGAGTLIDVAGFREGDVITALNNYPIPTNGAADYVAASGDDRRMVADVVRDGHRIALVIAWSAPVSSTMHPRASSAISFSRRAPRGAHTRPVHRSTARPMRPTQVAPTMNGARTAAIVKARV